MLDRTFTFLDLVKYYYEMSHDILLIGLFLVVFLDVLSGLCKAFFLKELSSSVSLKGFGKHSSVIIFGIFVYPILSFIGFEEIAMGMIGLAIVTYLISVAENFAQLGFPMPKWVIERLQKVEQVLEEKPSNKKGE